MGKKDSKAHDILVYVQPLHGTNVGQIWGVHFKMVKLLHTQLFAAGVSFTNGSQPVIIRYYYTPPRMREKNEEVKKAGRRGNNFNILERRCSIQAPGKITA